MDAPAIRLRGVSKFYKYYDREFDRVKEILSGRPRHRTHYALEGLDLEVGKGEVLGIVGKNGAGKSTLLKLLASTLLPSSGSMEINGRVAALLELGASFHPEMTGHENIYLNCSILGLKKREVDAIYERIVEFSGVREFIHRPVKTYSSGMFVRLAFAIATHIDPDILIIDEALSVGDGVFARKSFDRIMEFKDKGHTILFCTHSLYQIEAICDRVLWLEKGKMKMLDRPAEVVTVYGEALRRESPRQERILEGAEELQGGTAAADGAVDVAAAPVETPRIVDIQVRADGALARSHLIESGRTDIDVLVRFTLVEGLPMPTVAVAFTAGDGRTLASTGSLNDGVPLRADGDGKGYARIAFPAFPLLKGRYNVDVYLMCEKGVHIYEAVVQAAELNVRQHGLERGLVRLPHEWRMDVAELPPVKADEAGAEADNRVKAGERDHADAGEGNPAGSEERNSPGAGTSGAKPAEAGIGAEDPAQTRLGEDERALAADRRGGPRG